MAYQKKSFYVIKIKSLGQQWLWMSYDNIDNVELCFWVFELC
jgi:hypothetical protein